MYKHVRTVPIVLWAMSMVFFFTCISPAADDAVDKKEVSGKGPAAALSSMAPDGRLRIDSRDRCPVCGMFPAKRPKSAAGLMLSDGRTYYFCSNGCLLRSWQRAATYLGEPRESIQRMVVQDYLSGEPLDARTAWWVAGSDVIGPMGPALVTLKTPEAVEQFKARHGAKTVFQLERMDEMLWKTLFR